MVHFPRKLQAKLEERTANNALRSLGLPNNLVDFSSNDYLGFARNKAIFERSSNLLFQKKIIQNGATGSRLLSGNSELYFELENQIAHVHGVEEALLFNSGYDANIGFFSSVPQRGDLVLYDEYIHASIRDGIAMGVAKSYKFKHNNLDDLKALLQRVHISKNEVSADQSSGSDTIDIYIVTESVFSMDGDTPNLTELAHFCALEKYHLVVDEAHAIGVFGSEGQGLVFDATLQPKIFAQIVTFGKAMGCHGAAILGSANLKNYLINFARSFIYTTGMPPHALATISSAYSELKTKNSRQKLKENITFFNAQIEVFGLDTQFIPSTSAIHCCVISGIEKVKKVSSYLQKEGFAVKPILSPTVAKGQERLRFCLHSYNTKKEITGVLRLLQTSIKAHE
ncbi:aminotransferase class I/II-fold pyridoxal phosphate-dependent enzyme [Cellulophaga sp. Hel_I_12]|uniref:aminotransferase class I/II-fold pyridoxal phosphate-dependent enzyme n=1 Tax=Cellulophaga sp. Hel_I_12 TaxID=1249972 RepID=UPI000645CCCE|nr:aminotransferase class I/II-fold pyridoxal phosphate-dependent enzyme [Cellulophaga sp. Hel_I_12]